MLILETSMGFKIMQRGKPFLRRMFFFFFLLFEMTSFGQKGSIGTVTYSSSQVPVKPNLNFRNIPGLNNNQVKSFCQDYEGFLWIGTLNGLHKFDGSNFTLYLNEKGNQNSLPHSRIERLFEDSDKNLWIGTGDGVCRYNRDKDNFERIEAISGLVAENSPIPHRILDFKEDRNGMIWLVSNREGLFYFDEDLQKFESFIEKKDLDRLTSFQFSSLEIDSDGNLWVGTFDNGINIINPDSRNIIQLTESTDVPARLHSNLVNDLCVFTDGSIWVGTDKNGIDRLKWERERLSVKHYEHDPSNPYTLQNSDVSYLYVDKKGRLWSCNENGGLNLYNRKLDGFYRYFADLKNTHSMSSQSIWAIYEDTDDRIWLGTGLSGVDVSDPSFNKFAHYYISAESVNGIASNIIRDFWEDEDGNIWIATDGGGLNFYDRKADEFSSFENDPFDKKSISVNAVLTIVQIPDGKMWLGTWAGGVNVFDPEKRTFKILKTPDNVNLENVFHCYRDRADNIWFATYHGGLVKYDWKNKIFRTYMHDPENDQSISGDLMHSVFEDSRGDIYVGVRNLGLNVMRKSNIDQGIFERYEFDENSDYSIPSNVVNHIYEDSEGVIWVATEEGLAKFDRATGRFSTIKQNTGLNSMDIRSIIEDDNKDLWIRTSAGISRFDKAVEMFKNYTPADGVQRGSFLRHTFFKSSLGELFFAGEKGFNVFHPDSLGRSTGPPHVYFTDFKIFNQSVEIGSDTTVLQKHISQTKSITLTHDHWKFMLDFVAINFTRPENNEYAYIMHGLENNWNYVGNQTSATYTHLPPGEYTFQVMAANNDGVWNQEGASLQIIVLPAWWQTWWANVMYVVLFVALFFGFIRYRTRKLKDDRQRLELLIESRMAELKEKNTEILLQAEELKHKNEELAVLNASISEQAEELKSYNDALNTVNENLEKIVESRTQNLKIKNQELMTYSFENAHNVRGPLTRLMGLINLARSNHDHDVDELLKMMDQTALEMDQITKNIGEKLDKHFKDHD